MTALVDIARGWHVRYDSAPVVFSNHAIEQANRRLYRRLDLDAAAHQLYRDAQERGMLSSDAPGWLQKPRSRAIGWLTVDSLAFPLYGDDYRLDGIVAGTALTPLDTPVGATVRVVRTRP